MSTLKEQNHGKKVNFQVVPNSEDDNVDALTYLIIVSFENHSFQVKKTADQCCQLLKDLREELTLRRKPDLLTVANEEDLTFSYFENYVTQSDVTLDDVLASRAWLNFLENQKDVSIMTLIHIRILESKISAMTEKFQHYDSRLVQLERDSMSLKSIVNNQVASPTLNTRAISAPTNQEYESVFIEHKDRASELNSGPSGNNSTGEGSEVVSENMPPAPGNIFVMEEVDFLIPDDSNIIQQVLVPVISDVYPFTHEDECLPYFNAEADALLKAIQPHETQLQYRKSAGKFLKRHIRAALGVMSYEYDFQSINCFLPADVLKISIVLSQNQSPYWFTSVAEKLKETSEGTSTLSARIGENNDDEDVDLMQHSIRNINVVSEHETSKIICVMDSSLEVEICTNARLDTCFYLFLNEFNSLVGKENLFKRTILLVRSWWFYETAAYANTPIRHYLSDVTLAIMLVTIFNNYHQQINTVFEAFVYFLRDFSQYDGKAYAVSVQGIIPFVNEASNQPSMVRPQPNQLITMETMDKFWEIFNVHESANLESASSVSLVRPPAFQHAKLRQHMLLQSMQKASMRFERYGFNVIHPFLGINTVTEKLSTRRLSLISRVFQIGYATLTAIIDQAKANAASAGELFRGYLPSVYARFSNQWRPDALKNSILLPNGAEFASGSNPNELLNIVSDKLWQCVHYCNFIAESVISESALLTFCVDTLTFKGPLPAGELGKLLSEASSILNLSHKLREKFGGLKKFLERYPEVFVFSNDHPFNPHVLLRATISQENLELIDRGIFPVHLISKSVKTNVAKKPTKSSTMISTSSLPAALYSSDPHAAASVDGSMQSSIPYAPYMANKTPNPAANFGPNSARGNMGINSQTRAGIPHPGSSSHHMHQQQHVPYGNYNGPGAPSGSPLLGQHGYGNDPRGGMMHGGNHPQPHTNLYVQPSRHKVQEFHPQSGYGNAIGSNSYSSNYRSGNSGSFSVMDPPFKDSRSMSGLGLHQDIGLNDPSRVSAGHFDLHQQSRDFGINSNSLGRRKSPLDALDFSANDGAFGVGGSNPINPYSGSSQNQLNVFSSFRSNPSGPGSSTVASSGDFTDFNSEYFLEGQSAGASVQSSESSSGRYPPGLKGNNPFSLHETLSQTTGSNMSTMEDISSFAGHGSGSEQQQNRTDFDEISSNNPDSAGNNMQQAFSYHQYHRF